jgi:acetylornithine/N-succinyldiaminopimelate aminotransferase
MPKAVPASRIMTTYAPAPVTFVRGEGTVLEDANGKRYLDFLSGIAVTSLGHAYPGVAAAVERQAKRLVHVSNLFGNELAEPLAQSIDRLVGDGASAGGEVFFANSGAEANECAIKLARRYFSRSRLHANTVRHVVVSANGSFHGRTLATLHATGQPEKQTGFGPMPEGFTHVPFADLVALEEATRSPTVAAILLETIQGEGGVIPAPLGYLKDVSNLCRELGILLMIDEIQTGLGRTGRWFGFHHARIEPDVVTIAKALGNGFPIGACWARSEVADAFRPGDHGSTFGGQPLACAAALATLDAMVELDVPALAAARGARLSAGLSRLSAVAEVRGEGLLLGAVLQAGIDARFIVKLALEQGLVVNAPVPGVIRLAPPLTVSDGEIDEALETLAAVMPERAT